MSGFTLKIFTPEKVFYSGYVKSLVITTTEGEMGVLAHHSLMVVALETAPIRFKTEEGWQVAALAGGFAQIKGKQVDIFAHSAEWPEEIETSRALEAKKRAEDRLRTRLNEEEYLRSKVALQRAIMRLNVAVNVAKIK